MIHFASCILFIIVETQGFRRWPQRLTRKHPGPRSSQERWSAYFLFLHSCNFCCADDSSTMAEGLEEADDSIASEVQRFRYSAVQISVRFQFLMILFVDKKLKSQNPSAWSRSTSESYLAEKPLTEVCISRRIFSRALCTLLLLDDDSPKSPYSQYICRKRLERPR